MGGEPRDDGKEQERPQPVEQERVPGGPEDGDGSDDMQGGETR